MRIFLTGQDGFIGREILRQAREAGHEVMGLEKPFRMANPPWKEIEAFAPEVCIHCAWIATPGIYLESPENVRHREWTLAMIRRLAVIGTRRFVVAGTCAEYGPSDHPLRETEEPGSSTLYGREKSFLRLQLEEEALRSGFDLIWTRIFYPYGPGEHPDRLISFLIRNAISGKESPLKQPAALRDYIHVQDIARAFLLLAEKAGPGIFNIGTGEGVGLSALRSLIESSFGTGQGYPWDIDSSVVRDAVVADVSRISELGWKPRFAIKEGLSTYPYPPKKSQP
jgi:nucleoside-diphosphate-sugar epimerase